MSNGKDLMDIAINFVNKENIEILSDDSKIYYYLNNTYVEQTQEEVTRKLRKYARADRGFLPDTRKATLEDIFENIKAITHHDNLIPNYFKDTAPEKNVFHARHSNGILKLIITNERFLTFKLLPHSSDFFSPTQVSYPFNEKAGCKKFIAFLNSILGPSEIKFLQEWFGYLLIPTTRTHKFVVLRGLTGNGKSIILNCGSRMLGPDNVSNVPIEGFQAGARFVLIKTERKLLNIVEEVDETKSILSAVIKRYVAGNIVQVEHKFDDPRDMKPTARLMVSSNHDFPVTDSSEAFKRRLIILPFTIQISESEQNTDLDTDEYWLDELSGIKNWALRGLQRLIANKWTFTASRSMKEAIQSFSVVANPQEGFIIEYLEFCPSERLFGFEIFEAYKKHCLRFGIEPVANTVFARNLIKHPPGFWNVDQ